MKDKKTVAYFCMEFGLDDSFKIYSGGLGILAGDVLKGAKDIGYPMVGIGVLWRQGYTKQFIGEDDRLYDSYTDYKYDFLEDTGIMIDVMVRDCLVQIKVWKCERFGNVPLYLLDTFMGCNDDWYLTGQLYGWFGEERIAQELILGIGGVKALRALGIDVDTYHFNDSHPLFAVTELVKDHIAAGKSFDEACDIIREKIVFTTHTPVAAGNEEHEHRLVEYMGAYNGLTRKQMIKLGGDPFGMTVAGLRMSKKANGVAQLHGRTARKMWAHIEGGKDILSITNGVHCGTWWDKNIRDSYESKQDLWNPHMHLKRKMIGEIQKMNHVHLKEDVLTIGFARRVAPYKRSDLIFSNLEIIEPLLNEGKLQLVFSGKSHPNNADGKKIIMNLYKMEKKYPGSVVFVQNYGMDIGRMLTRGCDVWLNNPIRPKEASGTSGMKAAMNGVLNFSILDGWWPEMCNHGINGWQIGDGYEGPDCNAIDSSSLYEVLRNEIIPTYYNNRAKWIEMMYQSIHDAHYEFSAERMVRAYAEMMYD